MELRNLSFLDWVLDAFQEFDVTMMVRVMVLCCRSWSSRNQIIFENDIASPHQVVEYVNKIIEEVGVRKQEWAKNPNPRR